MATPLFPTTIIPPSQQNYGVKKPKNFIQAELDGGESRTRRDKIGGCYYVRVSWALETDHYTTISGFFRDRLQDGTRVFRIPLLIDVPVLVPYRARLIGEAEELTEQEGRLHVVSANLEVIPNPMFSFNLLCQNVADPRVVHSNNPDFSPDVAQFPLTREVMLTGCRGTSSGVAVNLDGTYTILSKPNAFSLTLQNAAVVNPGWTTLNGTVSQALFPDLNAGACILLPL